MECAFHLGRRQGWLLVPRARVSGHVRGAFRTAATQARLCHRHAEQLPQGVCLVAPPGGSHQRPRRDESGERTCLVQHSWGGGGVRAAWPSPRVLGISAVFLPVAGERRRNWMPWLQLSSWLVHSSIPQIFTKCSPCVRHRDNLVRFKHERVLCFKELVPWSSGWINPEVFVFVLISPRTCKAKSYQRPSVYFPI